MNPLQSRLAGVRRRLRFGALVRGVSILVLAVLGSLLLAGWLDWRLNLPGLVRAFLLLGFLGLTGWIGWRWLLAPLAARADDLTLALQIEKEYPILNDSLASTVQFLQQPDNDATGSPTLKREAVQRALRLAQGCDFNRIVPTRDLRWWTPAAGLVATLTLLLLLLAPGLVLSALLRLAHPFGEHDWERDTTLALEFRKSIANGQTFRLVGAVKRRVPGNVVALVEFEGIGAGRKKVDTEVKIDADGHGTFVIAESLSRGQRDFRFRVQVGDVTSPARAGLWHTVRVSRPPELVSLSGLPTPQIQLFPPAYTDQQPQTLSPGTGLIECLAGTRVTLTAAVNRPITQAWIEYRPAPPLAMLSAQLSAFGLPALTQPGALTTLTRHVAGREVWGPVPARLEAGGTVLTVEFTPAVTGAYVLHIEDAEGLANDYAYDLRVEEDPSPIVTMLRPSSNQSVLPSAEITLQILAVDEQFAIRSAWLEFRRKDKDGKFLPSGPNALELIGKVPLYEQETWNRAIPLLMVGLSTRPASILLPLRTPPGALPVLRHKHKLVEIHSRWSLPELLEEGDIIVIQACALDFNNLSPYLVPGRSAEIELKVVGRHELAAQLDEAQARIQQELVRLREWQNKALKNVIQAEEQWRGTGQLKPEDIQQLVEAEQLQKQIQARVGTTKDEGLRAEIDRLQQMVKDNKLPPTAAEDRLQMLKEELARLSREHLPQIEPRLTAARQKLDNPEAPRKPAPEEKGDLGQARQHQEEVQQALDDLLKHLERWASTQQIKGKTRAVLHEQKDIKGETEKVQKNNIPNDPQSEADLRRVAELQRRLAERTQQLLDEMERVAQERADKDPATAAKLKQAAEIARDALLPQNMKDIAEKQLKLRQFHRAADQQAESIKTLQQMLEALEDKREEELERLVKKQKKEQENLDELAERLEKLQKQTKEALKIADPMQRQEALKKLAADQRKLEEEARKKGRELARLRAQQAARAMQEAAEQMARAAKQLDEGENPEEAQREVLERIERAQDDLDQAHAEAEHELAREKLAGIADQIKGLKERQEAAIAESERIQRSLLQGGWTRGLHHTLGGHAAAQKGLAEETASLAEKLQGAKVFEMLMKRAARGMESAAKRMEDRQDKAVGRLGVFPLEKEILDDENKADREIQGLQKDAARRLQHLLEALKEELAKKPGEPQQGDLNPEKQGPEQPQQRRIPSDGIPALAQLKALRAEQADINERTKEIAARNPDPNNLQPADRAELEALHAAQEEVFRLLREIAAAANEAERK